MRVITKINSGAFGERYTRDRLWHAGYEVLAENYRTRHGEIDLVMKIDDFIVFVEVKTRSKGGYGRPSEHVDYRKQQKLIHVAQEYLMQYPSGLQPRFDVAEVLIEAPDNYLVVAFEHIENAFGL